MLRILLLSLCLLSPMVNAETAADKIILTVINPSTDTEIQLSAAMLAKMPHKSMTLDTPWYPTPQTFDGPLLRDVLKLAHIQSGHITLKSLNDYAISIPVSDALQYDVIVAQHLNGKPMPIRKKGPLFIIYPFHEHEELRKTDYYRRCSWQLRSIIAE